jgi:gas vesicle protein
MAERRDYIAAFVIGAMVGVGATLLLAPPKRKNRFVYELEPKLKQLRKRGRRLRKSLRPGR